MSRRRIPSHLVRLGFVLASLAGSIFFTASPGRAAAPSATWQQAGDAYQKGDWKKAAEAYAAITKSEPGSGRAWYRLGSSYARLGKVDEAIAALVKADEIGQSPLVRYDLACLHARRADSTQAFAWLEKAAASGFRSTDEMKNDADLVSLRGSPRFAAIMSQVERNDRPCAHVAEHRQLDFWVGEWQVTTPEGNTAGRNSITRENGDCWIRESWTSAIAGSGQSVNFYNATTKTWHQTWVDDQGEIAEFDGTLRDGAMRLEGYRQGPNGSRIPARLTLTPLPEGRVRQLGENSMDGGKTWTVLYDLLYTRQAAGAPSAAQTPKQ